MSRQLRQMLEKDVQTSKVEKVAIEYDARPSNTEFLTVEFENGNKYFFSDGEYGEVPVWRVETKKGEVIT